MRRSHYLQGNKGCDTPQCAIFLDTETKQVTIGPGMVKQVLWFGWAAYIRRAHNGQWTKPQWHRFTRPQSFWDWVDSLVRNKIKLYVFCHNSNFDYPVVDTFNIVPHMGWTVKKLIVDAPPTIIECRRGTATLMLLDTLNIWPMKLKKLGKSIDLPKMVMPESEDSPEAWDAYCRNDVEVIMRACMGWWDWLIRQDMGGFAPTIAGQALRSYRHRFMTHPILIDTDERALACSRACYHGGRTEAWRIGTIPGQWHLLDINSQYPAVMQAERYPAVLAGYYRNVTVDRLSSLMRTYLCCASVRIKTPVPVVPIEHNKRLVFPIGEFDATCSTPELRWLIKHGYLLGVYDVAVYTGERIFQTWVDEMYALRMKYRAEGNTVEDTHTKRLMNSLYGKYGQSGRTFDIIDTTDDLNPASWVDVNAETGESTKMRRIMGVIQAEVKEAESANSHPAIAAHVTAYGRMLLWSHIERAGIEHVIYMDTDSLLIDDVGLKRLKRRIDPDRLGALKHEATYIGVTIHGPKDYHFGDKVRTKGVKDTAVWLDDNTVEQDKWSGLAGMIRAGKADSPVTQRIVKHLRRTYQKGTVQEDGRVVPFVLGNGVVLD